MNRATITTQGIHPHRSAATWASALLVLLLPASACSSVEVDSEAAASAAGSGGASTSSAGHASAAGGGDESSSSESGSSSGAGPHDPCTAAPWARTFVSGLSSASQLSTAIDAECNTILTGRFMGTIDLGKGPLTADGGGLFVAKLDPEGHTIWSRALGALVGPSTASVAVDAQGDVLLAGSCKGTLDLGAGPLECAGGSNVFIAKLDPDGHPLWSHRYGSGSSSYGRSLAVTTSGNVVVGGSFSGDMDFGLGVLQASVGEHGFLVELDAAGNPLWQKNLDSPHRAGVTGVAADDTGAVTFTGIFATSVGLGFSSAGDDDAFVARCDAEGTMLWARQLGGSGKQWGLSVAVDATGNVAVGGAFDQTIDLGKGPVTIKYGLAAFAARLDPQGNLLWGRSFDDTPSVLPPTLQRTVAVALGTSGQLWMAGFFTKSIDFGGGPLLSPLVSAQTAFVAKLDEAGNLLGAAEYGGLPGPLNSGSMGDGIAVDAAGRARVIGTFTGTASFDAGTLTSAGDWNIFVATVDF